MQTEILYQVIDRYLGGIASEIEVKKVDDWYESFEKKPGFSATEKKQVEKAGLANLLKIKISLYNSIST